MFSLTVPTVDCRLIGDVQAGPGLAWNCQPPPLDETGTDAPNVLLVKSAGTVPTRYSWILLLVTMELVPCTSHSPDVALIRLHWTLPDVVVIVSVIAGLTVTC